MKSLNATSVRRAIISAATVIAISLPGIGSAGLLDRIKSRVQVVKTNTGNSAMQLGESRARSRAHSGFSITMAPSKKVVQNQVYLTYTIKLK